MNTIEKAKQLMFEQTQKNGAPAWELTEIAVEKGRELSKNYSVKEDLVVLSLYLAHTVFSVEYKGDIQKNHTKLSAEFSQPYLDTWGVSIADQEIILNAIRAHHGREEMKSKEAEVMRNAECFKFLTLKGCTVLFHHFIERGMTREKARLATLEKMQSKFELLTLEDCKIEAKKNCSEIQKVFSLSA